MPRPTNRRVLEEPHAGIDTDEGGFPESDDLDLISRARRGKGQGGHVYEVKISKDAFDAGLRAIYIQSLHLGRVQTMRKAAVMGLRTILSFDRQRILMLLQECPPGFHEGNKVLWMQLSEDEKDLLNDVYKAIGWVDPERVPGSRAETIALALAAGGDGEAITAVLQEISNRKQGRSRPRL